MALVRVPLPQAWAREEGVEYEEFTDLCQNEQVTNLTSVN